MTTPLNNSNKPSSALPIPRTHTPSTSTTPSTTQSPSDQAHARGQYEIFSNPVVTQDTRKKMLTTMLFTSCEKGNEQLVMSVLKQGADVNARNENNQTPLHLASQLGHLKVVKVLVQNGANCASLDIQGKSPLLIAIEARNKEIMAYLLPITMEVMGQKKEVQPKTILHQKDESFVKTYQSLVMALNSGSFKTCLEKLKKDNLSYQLGLILIDACHTNDLKLVKHLITEGEVDVNSRSINNSTPLHLVCQLGHHDLFEFLLMQKKIDLNLKNDQGLYPIELACAQGRVKFVEKLLKEGALLNYTTVHPLHYAIENKKTNVTKLLIHHLIKKGIDLNAPLNEGGPPPLHFACGFGNHEIVTFLLEQIKIDINAEYEGLYPIHIACAEKNHIMVEALLKKKPKLNNEKHFSLLLAIRSGTLKIVESVLTYHVKNEIDNNTSSEIAHAAFGFICELGNIEMAKLFLKYKDKYNLLSKNGYNEGNPLKSACQKGHVELVKLFLENNAETTANNTHGFTALHIAIYLDQIEMVQALLDSKKFNPFDMTEDGSNALDLAYIHENPSMIKLLQEHRVPIIPEEQFVITQNEFIKSVNEPEPHLSEEAPLTEDPIVTNLLPQVVEVKSPDVSSITTFPTTSTPVIKKNKSSNKVKKPSEIASQKPSLPQLFLVEWHENFKWPKSLNPKQQGIVRQHLQQLKNWPNKTGLDLKKMTGISNQAFRLRVGKHRVILSVDTAHQKIRIHSIALRKKAYDNLTKGSFG